MVTIFEFIQLFPIHVTPRSAGRAHAVQRAFSRRATAVPSDVLVGMEKPTPRYPTHIRRQGPTLKWKNEAPRKSEIGISQDLNRQKKGPASR